MSQSLPWKEQRQIWNAAGECSRQACRAPFHRRGVRIAGEHRYTGLLYCRYCTRLINDHNPEALATEGKNLVVMLPRVPWPVPS